MLAQALEAIPRVVLANGPTPLEFLPRFSAAVGAPIWAKRDDIGSLGMAGNKVRKLEYLVAAAQAAGATALVTVGALQSNHVRATASAAAKVGMRCVALLGDDRPDQPAGNHLLDLLFGAEVEFMGRVPWSVLDAALPGRSDGLRAEGERPFTIPMGGSTGLGAIGLARGYVELAGQLVEAGIEATRVVHASSSGGTSAGLEVGRALAGGGPAIAGVAVAKAPGVLEDEVATLANAAAAILGVGRTWSAADISLDHDHLGAAYGIPTTEASNAIRLLARTEGILADPVYSGKALAGLIDLVRLGSDPGPFVFWHTGGVPALFDPHYGLPLVEPSID